MPRVVMSILRLLRPATCTVVLCAGALCAQTPPLDLLNGPAPVFVRHDLSGRRGDLAQYRGRVVLLNFWATWCAPCQVELPQFAEWQQKYGEQGLQVLAVSMDDGIAPVRRTARRLHLGFPVMMGNAKLGAEYGGVLGLPVTFLIDRDGMVVGRTRGEADLNAMEREIQRALGKR
jgi:cytochrome c biogenesis protein CcmG/thiol:disulfide interchange protein DsbE